MLRPPKLHRRHRNKLKAHCDGQLSMLFICITVSVCAIAIVSAGCAFAQQSIMLASTTSVDNSGLLGQILPQFTKVTGIEVRVIALGTGQTLETAARGAADLLLVHDPDAEAAFVAAGHGTTRTEIAWNDFILVGPETDPARVAGHADVLESVRAIAAARSPFVTRGDRSGTDAAEKRLWKATGIVPAGVWYHDIGGGMGAALNAANILGAYILSDRGTWLSYGAKGGMKIVLEGNRRLINLYDVIRLTPGVRPAASLASADRLADWLSSASGQAAIGGYAVGGQKLFPPEADRKP